MDRCIKKRVRSGWFTAPHVIDVVRWARGRRHSGEQVARSNSDRLLLAIILFVALILRMWGVAYDLPYVYHADEPRYIGISQHIFKTGDLNPHFFNYPSLFFYINALAYVPYYILGSLIGLFDSRTDILPPISLTMGVTRTPMPTTVLLGRAVTVFLSVATVWLVYVMGRRFSSRMLVGALASLMVAISPANVAHGRLITPDTLVTCVVTIALLASWMVYENGGPLQSVVAGACVGLAASCKYNGALIILPLMVAHIFRYGKTILKQRGFYLAMLFAGVGFLVTTPYALLDPSEFMGGLRYEARHYATGHAGMEGNTLEWYLHYMWRTGGVLYIVAVLEILRGIWVRSKSIILLSVFPVTYFAFINSFVVRNDRTALPLTPFMFLLSASFQAHLIRRVEALRSMRLRRLGLRVTTCLATVAIVIPASTTIAETIRLTAVNSRETGREWICNNLPMGAKIAVESYAPFVDPSRFVVTGVTRIIDREPEWYIEHEFDYLVVSEGMYGRFYQAPERYRKQVSEYEHLFTRFDLVKRFTDGGQEIRIYHVKQVRQ